MSIHTFGQRFFELVHQDLQGSASVEVRSDRVPHSPDEPVTVVLRLGDQEHELGSGLWVQHGTDEPITFTALAALEKVINGHAPDYWKEAYGRLQHDSDEVEAGEPLSDTRAQARELDLVVATLGWLDRRIGKRTVAQVQEHHDHLELSTPARDARNLRLNGFLPHAPAPRSGMGMSA